MLKICIENGTTQPIKITRFNGAITVIRPMDYIIVNSFDNDEIHNWFKLMPVSESLYGYRIIADEVIIKAKEKLKRANKYICKPAYCVNKAEFVTTPMEQVEEPQSIVPEIISDVTDEEISVFTELKTSEGTDEAMVETDTNEITGDIDDLTQLSRNQLQKKCVELGISYRKNMTNDTLIKLITANKEG